MTILTEVQEVLFNPPYGIGGIRIELNDCSIDQWVKLPYAVKWGNLLHVVKNLPHGSGIDYDWNILQDGQVFTCRNAYHMMDDNGMYCGIVDFAAIIDMAEKTVDVVSDNAAIEAINKEYLDGRKEWSEDCDCFNCRAGKRPSSCEYLFSIDIDGHNDYLANTIYFSLFG